MCKELTEAQYALIAHLFPKQRGNVALPNIQVLNALLYMAEQGCKWRALPERFGRWHTVYTRLNRWAYQGVLEQVWAELLRQRLVAEGEFPLAALDAPASRSTSRARGLRKKGGQAIGRSRGGLTTKLHAVALDPYTPLILSLTPGQWGDAPEGRRLLGRLGEQHGAPALVMDRAYEGDQTRAPAAATGWQAVVPPRPHRRKPWDYDLDLYKERNVVERLFNRFKRWRRITTRFDKLDALFLGFIHLALIFDNLSRA